MRTRISRTFLAVLAATAVTASMGVSSSQAATCKVDGFKITKRKNVSCKTAKKVTRRKVSGESLPRGWKCTNTGNLIPEGKCTKRSTNSSFKYAYAN
jgi:hypothetical protein